MLNNYQTVLTALKKATSKFRTDASVKANSLQKCLCNGKTALGLIAALTFIDFIKHFNKGLQRSLTIVSRVLTAADCLDHMLMRLRIEEDFQKFSAKPMS